MKTLKKVKLGQPLAKLTTNEAKVLKGGGEVEGIDNLAGVVD